MTKDIIEIMANVLHDSWRNFMISKGFTLGPRDYINKTHPHLCAWDELDDIPKEQCRFQALSLITYLSNNHAYTTNNIAKFIHDIWCFYVNNTLCIEHQHAHQEWDSDEWHGEDHILQAKAVIMLWDAIQCCDSKTLKYWQPDTNTTSAISKRIDSLDMLSKMSSKWKEDDNIVIAGTNGCFDMITPYHVRFLNAAKSFGSILVVGVNTDKSISSMKKSHRPFIPLEQRIEILSYFPAVDFVVPFDDPDPIEFIRSLKPDVYIKTNHRPIEKIVEADTVREVGADLIYGISCCDKWPTISQIIRGMYDKVVMEMETTI